MKPKFRNYISITHLRIKLSLKVLYMRLTDSPETSVLNHLTPRKDPEEGRLYCNRGESRRSPIELHKNHRGHHRSCWCGGPSPGVSLYHGMFGVFMAFTVKFAVFWTATPYNAIKVYLEFDGIFPPFPEYRSSITFFLMWVNFYFSKRLSFTARR